ARDNLAQRDHSSCRRAPDLHTSNGGDVAALCQRRPGDDRKQSGFLGVDARSRAARLSVKAHDPSFESRFQGLRDVNAGHAVSDRLKLEVFGLNHLFRLAPVDAHALGSAIVLEDSLGLARELAQYGGIGPADTRLDASSAAGTQKKFLRHRVSVWVVAVQVILNRREQPIDFPVVIDVDQELNERRVLLFRCVDQQEAETAASDERRYVSDSRLISDEAFEGFGESLRVADVGTGGQKSIYHELRPCRRRGEDFIPRKENAAGEYKQ